MYIVPFSVYILPCFYGVFCHIYTLFIPYFVWKMLTSFLTDFLENTR